METLYFPVRDEERERTRRIVILSYSAIAMVTIGIIVLNVTLIILERTSADNTENHVNNTNSTLESVILGNISSTDLVKNEKNSNADLLTSSLVLTIPRQVTCPPEQRRKADGSCGKVFVCKGNKRDRKNCKENNAKKANLKKHSGKEKGQQLQDRKSKSS